MTREMKNSGIEWIGEIPADWKTTKLKNVITFLNGYAFDSSELSNEGEYPVIRIGDITNGKIDFINANKTNTCNEVVEKFTIKENDILIAMSGATVGKTGVAHNVPNKSFINQRVGIIRSEANRYIYHYLNNGEFIKYILLLSVGSAQPNISTENIYNYYIPVPPFSEQKKIADFLDSKVSEIDKMIAETKSSIENYKEYKQSVITEAVTKGLNKNVQMKDSGIEWIGKISENATVTTAGKLFNIILGKMISPNQTKEDETFESYFCAANVHFEDIQYNGLKRMWFSEKEKEIYKVQKGDLLVVEGGAGAGGSHIVDVDIESCYIQNSIMIARTKSNTPNKWLYYVIYSLVHQGYIDFVCNKATIPHFTKEKLQNVPVVFFEEETMNKIIDYLDKQCSEIDNLILEKEAMLVNLEEYKKSLIYEYVTGKKIVL